MTPSEAALAFVSLLVIVDPLALAPVFAALTAGMEPAATRRTALVGVAAGFGLLAAAGIAGHALIAALAPEARIVHLAGAVVLGAAGLAMLAGGGGIGGLAGGPRRRDPALVPLAVPLIAGPGGCGAMAVFAARHYGDPAALATLYALLALVGLLSWLALGAAPAIAARLGPRGVLLVGRILGLVLLLAAGRFLLDAIHAPASPT